MPSTSRRDFLKTAAFAAGASGLAQLLPAAIEKAHAIDPAPGSTVWDAEHVVILMQENRSFDHAFGSLQGVRGFEDPRAITLPDGDPAWVQTDSQGNSYAPYRLDIKNSKSTWMGCLPHGWTDQVDARNAGRYDGWLDAKRSGTSEYADLPLTMGFYTREDLPFYYALADAFTICDQHFCSSLTGTTPNRLYLWSGKIRHDQRPESPAKVHNSDADHRTMVHWRTFPELLENEGISWKVYQNELYLDLGLGEGGPWLDNFGDNPLEYFSQYHVRFAESNRKHQSALAAQSQAKVDQLQSQLAATNLTTEARGQLTRQLTHAKTELAERNREAQKYSAQAFAKLTDREQILHAKAFVTNSGDPAYHDLEEVTYRDGDTERSLKIPKGDVLHQFRRDVESGNLPAVSWVVAPEKFSDHPCSPWYGAWYLAECFNILTENPEVWKKTVFLLTYDENDGYFDHFPPFVAPDPRRPESGRVSPDIDASVEQVNRDGRDSPIGLGYRVPMIIASPWSRGGAVCSQVFDHTSPIQFIEQLLSKKLGRTIRETNISQWRRTVCGDLMSAFQPAADSASGSVAYTPREPFIASIDNARYQPVPTGHTRLTADDRVAIRENPKDSPHRPRQEPGDRPSCPLPYELSAEGQLSDDRQQFTIQLHAGTTRFGNRSAGAPFTAYFRDVAGDLQIRNYAISPGKTIDDSWPLAEFAEGIYDIELHGPNGFYRHFRGSKDDPALSITLDESKATTSLTLLLQVTNDSQSARQLIHTDRAYRNPEQQLEVSPTQTATGKLDTTSSSGWYDFQIHDPANLYFLRAYAGRLERGAWSRTDPQIGASRTPA